MRFKKIYILCLLCFAMLTLSEQVSAQHYIGVRGGFGNGSSRLYPEQETSALGGLYHGGVSWKFFTAERFVGGVQVDLLFMQQGYKYFGNYLVSDYGGSSADTTGYYQRSVNSVVLPLMWQPHFYFSRQRLRVFLNAGITLSFNINSHYEVHSQETGIIAEGDHKLRTTRDNRFGYGLVAGGGFGWSFNRWEAVLEARYYIGYSDILKNRNKFEPNYFLRSPLDGMQFSVGLYYRLGKEGIRAKPSRQTQLRMDEWEQRQARRAAEKDEGTHNDPTQANQLPDTTPEMNEEQSTGQAEAETGNSSQQGGPDQVR